MGLIFTLIQSLHLAPFCWSTWSTSVMMVNIKVVHFHMVLDDMVIVDQGWLRNQKINWGKVVKKMKLGQMTIITCEMVLS